MNFDLLRQSIELNAGESPSLYNTLNMIRALFQDVEDAADMSLSQCPTGDEKLPLEMIWLSKELLSIYEDNTDALQRNRARLDSIMKEIRTLQDELEKLADAASLLPEKEKQYQELLSQLKTARAAQGTYEELIRKIETAQKDLAGLQRFDFDAAQQQLVDLQNQIRVLEDQIRELDTTIQKRTDEKNLLESNISNLRHELTQVLQPEQQHLTQQKQALEEEHRCTRQLIADLRRETDVLNAELAQMRQDLPLLMQERNAARQRVADYHRDMLDPVITERDALLETEDQLQADKAAAEKQIAELTENQQKLVLEIGRKKEAYRLDNTEYQNKLEREKKLIAEQEELTRNLNKITEDLSLRQDEYDELHDKTLPAAQKYLAAETKRRDDLQAQIDTINNECQEKTTQISELDAMIPGRQEELRRLRSRYDALTITFNTNNQDILEMERQIRELEVKNDKERLDEYRTQLQSKQKELEALAQNCEKLDAQIRDLDTNLKDKNEDCRTLEELKRKKEEGLKGIEETLLELKPCSAPEYRRRAEAIDAKFRTLVSIRNNLAESISLAGQTISDYKPTPDEESIQKLETYLTKASARSLDVYQQLMNCANALKNHIMEEPK